MGAFLVGCGGRAVLAGRLAGRPSPPERSIIYPSLRAKRSNPEFFCEAGSLRRFAPRDDEHCRLFRGLAAIAREHSLEPAANDRFRFADDPGDKLGAARNIVDQALNLPR